MSWQTPLRALPRLGRRRVHAGDARACTRSASPIAVQIASAASHGCRADPAIDLAGELDDLGGRPRARRLLELLDGTRSRVSISSASVVPGRAGARGARAGAPRRGSSR